MELQSRTKAFAVRVIRLYRALSRNDEGRILGRQMMRSGTSVAANYRAACRAKSRADFISKMGTVVEEADETLFWMELLTEACILNANAAQPLMKEAEEILRIFAASLKTARTARASAQRSEASTAKHQASDPPITQSLNP